jgi:putative hemolysin
MVMQSDVSRYRVRLARNDVEREGAQRLRYRVFVEEMGARVGGRDEAAQLERDAFDGRADHLVLVDEASAPPDPRDAVVGTYRLMRGDAGAGGADFYTSAEYDLSAILRSGRPCVELSRSCVARDHRGGAAMHLLWNGVAEYVADRRIEILFGVASFPGTDPARFAEALSFLHHRHLAPPEMRARALAGRFIRMDRMPPEAIDPARALRGVPPLIRAYLRFGGAVGDGACIDAAFNTLDVFMAMDTARMTERYGSYLARASGGRS